MIFIILLCEVLKDTTALEKADTLAVFKGICQRGDAAVGVDLEKPWLFLAVSGYVDVLDFVGKTEFFEAIEILIPLGVESVYRVMLGCREVMVLFVAVDVLGADGDI